MTQTIRDKIRKYRDFMENLDGKAFSWACNPCPDFPDKGNYPLDFQIFMKEIGEMYMGSDPTGEGNGYLVINLESPKTVACIIEAEQDHKQEDTDLWFWLDANPHFATKEEYLDEEFNSGLKYKDVMICAMDVDSQHFGFDSSVVPYKFVAEWTDDGRDGPSSFFTWFKNYTNRHLEDVGYSPYED